MIFDKLVLKSLVAAIQKTIGPSSLFSVPTLVCSGLLQQTIHCFVMCKRSCSPSRSSLAVASHITLRLPQNLPVNWLRSSFPPRSSSASAESWMRGWAFTEKYNFTPMANALHSCIKKHQMPLF